MRGGGNGTRGNNCRKRNQFGRVIHLLPIPLRILDLAFRALTDIAARIDHIDGLVLFIIPAGDARISEKGVAGRADDVVVFQFGLDCQGCHCIIFSRGIQINTPLWFKNKKRKSFGQGFWPKSKSLFDRLSAYSIIAISSNGYSMSQYQGSEEHECQ